MCVFYVHVLCAYACESMCGVHVPLTVPEVAMPVVTIVATEDDVLTVAPPAEMLVLLAVVLMIVEGLAGPRGDNGRMCEFDAAGAARDGEKK